MKKVTRITALFVLALFALTNCTQQVAVDVSDEIKAKNEQLVNSFMDGDLEALTEMYTNDAAFLPPNSDAVVGKEAIKETWKGMLNMGLSKVILNTIEAKSYGLIAVEEGRYEMYIEDQMVDYGKYIVIWEKVGEDWKLAKDIINTSVPPPPPPAPEAEIETD